MLRPDDFSFLGDDLVIMDLPDGLALHGCCDTTSAVHLAAVLDALRAAHREPARLDLGRVSFADSRGLEPVAEHVRWCRRTGRPEPELVAVSGAVIRVLRALGVGSNPFDVDAWDRAGRRGLTPLPPLGAIEPDGGGRRFRGESPPASVPSAAATTTFIGTTHQCAQCAAVEVRGVLDLSAGALLASMIATHGAARRTVVFVDTAGVTGIEPAVFELLARAESNASVELMISPLGPGVTGGGGLTTST